MSENSIENLRSKSYKELSETFSIKEREAKELKHALDPKYFSIITNRKLSSEEMAKETGLSKGTILTYRSALIKTGMETRISTESDKILSFLKSKPSTYEEISEGIGKSQNQVKELIDNVLKRKDKVRNILMTFYKIHPSNLPPYQFFDGVAVKAINYLPGEERLLGEKVIEYLPKGLDTSMRKSLTQKFKRILPEEAFEVIYENMCKSVVK